MATSYGMLPETPSETPRAKTLDVRAYRKLPVRHLRAPVPIDFPEEEEVPEGLTHLVVRTFLFQLLRFALGDAHTVGSEQFVYWNGRGKEPNLAPDVFVKLDRPQTRFGSWKTWEQGGVPELAVEVISPNEDVRMGWDVKLSRYHELGVSELVCFDPEAPEGRRLRVWDRVDGDLVEREVEGDMTPCQTLGLAWVVRAITEAPVALRLVDAAGELVLDARETEAQGRAAEARRADAEATRADAEAQGRASAEARVRELEAELRRRT